MGTSASTPPLLTWSSQVLEHSPPTQPTSLWMCFPTSHSDHTFCEYRRCPNHKLVNDNISFVSMVEKERLFLVNILPMKITFCCPRNMNWLRGFREKIGGGRNGSPLNPKAKSQFSHLRSKAKTWVPQIYRWKVFSVEEDSSYLTMLGKHYEKENP